MPCSALPIGFAAAAALRRWVLVPWEFARFNLLGGGSALYGAHPWHWNLSQGFPAVAATLLPLMALGVALALDRRLAALAALSLAAYSLPAHKEFRFLLPALQLVMPYCGVAVAWLLSGRGGSAAAPVGPKGKGTRGSTDDKSRQGVKAALVAAALLAAAAVQVAMALYFSLVQHRCGNAWVCGVGGSCPLCWAMHPCCCGKMAAHHAVHHTPVPAGDCWR